jgi:hypothetical protein
LPPSIGRQLKLLDGFAGVSLLEREQALCGKQRRLRVRRNVRGLSYRLGRAREKLRLACRCQRSDDRHGIEHCRPLSIYDGEDLAGQETELSGSPVRANHGSTTPGIGMIRCSSPLARASGCSSLEKLLARLRLTSAKREAPRPAREQVASIRLFALFELRAANAAMRLKSY